MADAFAKQQTFWLSFFYIFVSTAETIGLMEEQFWILALNWFILFFSLIIQILLTVQTCHKSFISD